MSRCGSDRELPPVTSKAEFYAASKRLLLGNRLQQWDWSEFTDMYLAPHQEQPLNVLSSRISLRTTRSASTNAQRYRITPRQMYRLGQSLLRKGFHAHELLVDESAPDHCVQLQAEVMQDERYLYMRYAINSGVGMRQAYPTMQHAYGLKALAILKEFLDGSSMDNLNWLLSVYNNAVVELSSYPCKVGVLGWNSLVWEVRSGY